MNKKRLFSILLAVVMIMAAINLAPVLEVLATSGIGQGNATKGPGYHEWDNREGNWTGHSDANNPNGLQTGSLTYAEDGAYSSTVGTDSTADPNYRTRHVTMFNDCDPHYNADAISDDGTWWLSTPAYQIQYNKTGGTYTWTKSNGATGSGPEVLTNRNNHFTTIDQTADAKTAYKVTSNQYWYAHVNDNDSPLYAPWVVDGYGCSPSYDKDFNVFSGWTAAQAKAWTDQQTEGVYFYSDDDGDCDFRMAFRNFNNTDTCIFNPSITNTTFENGKVKTGTPNKLTGNQAGINIGEYDYLEFDLKITEEANWKKSRSGKPTTQYSVLAYYEPNCGAGEYCDLPASFIQGWNEGGLDFTNQLSWNDDGSYAKAGQWVTIRLPIPEKVKNWQNYNYAKPTVKQFTIRMIGGNAANKKCIYINDVRLVKNDDHIGKVMTHDNNGTSLTDSKYTQYPSGEYYMINDFEFNDTKATMYQTFANGSTAVNNSSNHLGIKQPYSSDDNKYPLMYRVYRSQEINLDDSEKRLDITSSSSWGAVGWGNKGNNVYACEQGVGVTQGDYAVAIGARERLYTKKANSWKFPTYYERHYADAMDLSQYSHFAIDVFIRTENSKGIQKNSEATNAQGVTFAIDLFNNTGHSSTWGDSDNFNYKNGHSVKFLLPYGKDCWEGDETQSGYGEILQLGDKYYKGEYTANGSMRFVFTREDLLEGQKGDGGSYTLNNINAMRFLWLNRVWDNTEGTASSVYNSVKDGSQLGTGNRVDIILDNFIAYNVDTSLTVKNVVPDTTYLDAGTNGKDGQSFVYRLQGGYVDRDQEFLKINDFKKDGTVTFDSVTQDVDLTLTVPANGSVTIRNLPFGALYLSQQSWAWRYTMSNIEAKQYDGNSFTQCRIKGNTIAILPQNTATYNTAIYDIMKRRHFTVTFTQDYVKRDYGVDPNDKNKVPTQNDAKTNRYANKRWLDGSHTANPAG